LKAYLLLEDGSVFEGLGFGAAKNVFGELVFNTGMTGYQENLTDPSYNGQILLMTYPLIGNYGCVKDTADYKWQSGKIQAEGFVVSEYCRFPHTDDSNRTNRPDNLTIDQYLKEQGIPGIANVDTRELTVKIRQHGTIKCVLAVIQDNESPDIKGWLEQARLSPSPDTTDLVSEVTVAKPMSFLPAGQPQCRVVVIDCGAKRSIIRELLRRDCEVYSLPYNCTPADIESINPDGILVSNGPGDPAHPAIIKHTVQTIKKVIAEYPVWGICLGHQILSLVFGAKTYKLKFGHRGVNQPVKNLETNKLIITSQNHGFAVDAASCSAEIKITEVNLNDGTVEAMRHKTLPVYSVQYHPEASPGPHDSNNFFDEFVKVCLSD